MNQVIPDVINEHGTWPATIWCCLATESKDFRKRLIAVKGLNISKPDYGHELWRNLAEGYTGQLVGVIDGDIIEILHKQHTNVLAYRSRW